MKSIVRIGGRSKRGRPAAVGLEEGLEETLTLHRLGLFKELGRSFKTTNCIENLNALIGQRMDKVDRWRHADQKHRWLPTTLLDIEPRLRKVSGYQALPRLRADLEVHTEGMGGRWRSVWSRSQFQLQMALTPRGVCKGMQGQPTAMVPVGRLAGREPGEPGSAGKQNRSQDSSLKPVARRHAPRRSQTPAPKGDGFRW